jgi:LysR family nitrogen assimilation transcriptional regulator
MNLRQINYFICIAQTGSFSAAADTLHVAQSALSRHMRDLEYELGGVLFDRGPRGVTLSDSGKVLFSRAKFILLQLEEARTEVLAHNKEVSGTVRLMAPSSIGQILFQPLVDRFLGQFPKVFLDFSEGLWHDSVNRLQSGTVDIAIMGETRTSEYIEFEPLAYEQMILLGRDADPLVRDKSIPVDALAGLPLLMPEMTLEVIRRFAPQLSEKLRVTIFVESAPVIRSFTESGHGYAVVPSSVLLGTLEKRKIKGVPIEGLEVLRQIGTLRGRPKSRGMQELTAAIRHAFDGFIGAGLMRSP